MQFADRVDAGRKLAEAARSLAGADVVVLGLPRGGVVCAYEVARALGAPLDVMCVRKLGVPFEPELGMGAIAEGDAIFLDLEMVASLGITEKEVEEVIARKRAELAERVRLFAGGVSRPDLAGKTVVLVDDGIATGGTVRAAVRAIRARHPRRIVLAVPVAAASTLAALRAEVDEVVCLTAPDNLYAIGQWYFDFEATEDEEVVELLARARSELSARPAPAPPGPA